VTKIYIRFPLFYFTLNLKSLYFNKKILLFLFIILTLLSVQFVVAAPPASCTSLFCISDYLNATTSSGNSTVQICAGTVAPVKNFNIWFNGTGPLNFSSGGIISGTYQSSAAFTDGSTLTNTTNGGCVNLYLNSSTLPYTTTSVPINATVYNKTDYSVAASECSGISCNGTRITTNYIYVGVKDAGGNSFLPNSLLMTYNNVTKAFVSQGPALTGSDGVYSLHCVGAVVNGNCVNVTSTVSSNACYTHGIPFPAQGGGAGSVCDINTTTTLFLFDFISSNVSSPVNVTPLSALTVNLVTTASVGFVEPGRYSSQPGFFSSLNLTELNITEYDSGSLVYNSRPNSSSQGPKGGMPFFISSNKLYLATLQLTDGVVRYPLVFPSSGISGVNVIVPNSSVSMTTLVGKIVNETNVAVANAVVYVQFFRGGGGAFGIQFINSSVTDANGRFSVTVPTTQFLTGNFPYPTYQFYIVSNTTNGNIPLYFPTVDTNNNKGYFAQGTTVALPPSTIKAAGLLNINVTINSASMILSELSSGLQFGHAYNRLITSGKFTMLSIFSGVSAPSSLFISLISPVSTTGNLLFYNLLGKQSSFGGSEGGSSGFTGACSVSGFSVSQGVATSSTCNLTTPGYLNLRVNNYNDIFNPSNGQAETLSNFGFWFETNLILRNTSGTVVYYLGPDGTLLQDLVGFGFSSSQNISLPLPPGNYTVELFPSSEFSRYLNVRNDSTLVITPGATVNLNISRAQAWMIEPRFSNSFSLSANNPVTVAVRSFQGPLTNTSVTVNAKLLYLNKTVASSSNLVLNFTNAPSGGAFMGQLNPTTLGITQAGKYFLFLNVSNVSGTTTYMSSKLLPVNIFDFGVGLDINGFVFNPGQNLTGKIFAFNSTNDGITATAANVTFRMFDGNGVLVSPLTATSTSIVAGEGSFNLTMPSTLGFYQILTTILSNDGKQGVAEKWVQVNTLGLEVSTDRQGYAPSDNVTLSVRVLNASSGSGIANTSVEVTVSGFDTPLLGVTDSTGKVTLLLDPVKYTRSGQWAFGFTGVRVKVTKDTGTDVIRLEQFVGFNVRGLQAYVQTDKPTYQITDTVLINVFTGGSTVTNVTATLDGNSSNIFNGLNVVGNQWRLNFSTNTVGRHGVEITLTDSSGNTQKLFTGFDVNAFSISISTDKFTYAVNSLINLTVKAQYPNATSVGSTNVIAILYKPQQGSNLKVGNVSGVTDSTGTVYLLLNATKSGFNFIDINISGQRTFIGVIVSSLRVNLTNSTGGTVTNYQASPGNNVTLYVNVTTASGVAVADGSRVTARILAFGTAVDLPSNTTLGGISSIVFQVPSNAPAQVYGLEVSVATQDGSQGYALPATLTVSGGSSQSLTLDSDRGFLNPYSVGDTARFTTSLTYANGSGVSGSTVIFEIGSESVKSQVVGSVVTSSAGLATLSYNISSNLTDGAYFLHGYVSGSSSTQAYSGFLVNSLAVIVNSTSLSYNLGQNITLLVRVANKTSGSPLNATSIFVSTFNRNKGQSSLSFDPTGLTQPYNITIPIPNEVGAVGSYPISVTAFLNSSQGSGFRIIDVRNSSTSLNMTLPTSITAGVAFTVNLSASTGSTASLVVFSPSATSLVYQNTSITLSGSPATASVTVNLTSPGFYIFNSFVSGIGAVSNSSFVTASSSSTAPSLWTGTSTSANATSFATTSDVYLLSNTVNATATVLTLDSNNGTLSLSVPLNLQTGSTSYGVFNNTNLVSGRTYFVRLDTSSATDLTHTIFKVA